MYYKIEDFKNDWAVESEATLKIFNNLTDESLNRKFNEKIRTPERIAWHIINSAYEMMNETGLKLDGYKKSEVPKTAAEIVKKYQELSASLIESVIQNWNDKSLLEKLKLYGEEYEKGKLLSILMVHQIHHRAQLIIVMRLAGLKVPGIYGPSQEEWTEMGMEAQE